jgi:magnesium chelatase accessory protein
MGQNLDWERDGPDWTHHESSRFILAGGLRWHVQTFEKPASASNSVPQPWVLLIHGTGSSTHSWRDVIPLLAADFSVIAVDLPGHGFTGMPQSGSQAAHLSMIGMARSLGALLKNMGLKPELVVGHSAGAAIGVRMCLAGWVAPRLMVSLNGALLPLGGLAGQFFSPAAKLMSVIPAVPRLFSWHASDPAVVKKLIGSTGSKIDARGMALYSRLVRSPAHAAGALGMMAHWDLETLAHDLPGLTVPLLLVVGENDRTVPPQHARRVAQVLSSTAIRPIVSLPDLGHLAHEEDPPLVAKLLRDSYQSA